jgi:hypothetical protein
VFSQVVYGLVGAMVNMVSNGLQVLCEIISVQA